MSYVKYTAADGTVHLCHEDSPMLMHANKMKRAKQTKSKLIGSGGRATKMAYDTFSKAWRDLSSYCDRNKIQYTHFKGNPPYDISFFIQYKDKTGHMLGNYELDKITLHDLPYKDYEIFVEDSEWRDKADQDVLSMNKVQLNLKEQLKKYKLTSGGYYESK